MQRPHLPPDSPTPFDSGRNPEEHLLGKCYNAGMLLDIGSSSLGGRAIRLAFYEWAYGRLGEADVDIGALGEFVVGLYIGGLSTRRRETATYDLVTEDGATVEVKTTTGIYPSPTNRSKVYRWNIADQRRALAGERPLAQTWVFLVADFPNHAARFFNVFDPACWTAYVLSGTDVKRLAGNSTNFLGAAALRKAGYAPLALADLPRHIAPSTSPTAALARENSEQALVLLRLAYFQWAYGDLHDTFNAGRLAEFQVMRLIGQRPFKSRSAFGAADLISRRGFRLEVKFSRNVRSRRDGTPIHSFLLTSKHHFKAENFDFAVFCQLNAPDADPIPFANWSFRWVPSSALVDHHTRIDSTTLERMGFTLLTSTQLKSAESSANLPPSSPISA